MAEFTKGPWSLSEQNDSVCGNGNTDQVAHCQSQPGCGMLWDRKEIRANARLIAAAPEMYELLRDVFTKGKDETVDSLDWIDKVAAVLGKARGITERYYDSDLLFPSPAREEMSN